MRIDPLSASRLSYTRPSVQTDVAMDPAVQRGLVDAGELGRPQGREGSDGRPANREREPQRASQAAPLLDGTGPRRSLPPFAKARGRRERGANGRGPIGKPHAPAVIGRRP